MTLDAYIKKLSGKRAAVLGIGVSNTPLIELLAENKIAVRAHDKRDRDALGDTAARLEKLGVELKLGEDYLEDISADIIFRTPGMHPFTKQLLAAKRGGAVITSEMEAFFAVCPCRVIAVTGSDGKTTTSTVISELLKARGYTVHLGGNIGRPLLTDAPGFKPEDFAVLELSSFQLHSMKCSPDIAVVTNVSPNHLDVHPGLNDYIGAKRNIFLNQKKAARLVLNLDNGVTRGFAADARGDVLFFSREEETNGVFLRDDIIYAAENGEPEPIMKSDEILLPGVHNAENYMAAFCAVRGLVSHDIMRSVAKTFTGVEHRLELVRALNGVRYINDSIASSPTRTIAGLRSCQDKPILIAGGYDKNIPFDELGTEINRRVKALFLTGHTADKIMTAVKSDPDYDPQRLPIEILDGFDETVFAASRLARPGDTVLMSPACASFDKFKNFAERGETFKNLVLGLEE
jgi:UDP-N-acetylmuramoylalanine--D-glutamate ligase